MPCMPAGDKLFDESLGTIFISAGLFLNFPQGVKTKYTVFEASMGIPLLERAGRKRHSLAATTA